MTKILPGMLTLALLALLILQWKDWPPPLSSAGLDETSAADEGTTGKPGQDPLANLKPPDDRDNFASIIERPLFRPDRKPEPPPDESPPATADPGTSVELDTLDLSAVMLTPMIVSAWVKDPNQPNLRRLRIGDDLEGWSVRDILEDRVLLERQGEEYALILRDYSKATPTAPTPIPRRPSRAPARAEPPVIDR
ncbi:hypothetical protein CCR95_21660 [Thiocystis minor]|uniref:hypothetical protein n=1 Tax=Thiocystis minor TaxID=61597 RepID=UPI0019136CB0|nr:hypothetical protein [Thiocystis minor]MBK5966609.1 hypothetical protein [Thiocystis minor]